MKPRALNKEQIKFIIDNHHLPNGEIAKKLDTNTNIVALYKTRLRKAGFDIPKQKGGPKESTFSKDIAEIIKEKNKKEAPPENK